MDVNVCKTFAFPQIFFYVELVPVRRWTKALLRGHYFDHEVLTTS